MTKEIEEYEPIKQELIMSDIFAESGLFPDIKTKAEALVKVLAGKELGMSAFESVASIYIVNGKLALTSKAMASMIKKSPTYDYTVDTLTDEYCSITFYETVGDEEKMLGVSKFTIKDGAKAGLVNKEVWKSYPKNMLFARAISNGARWYCPEAISGYYTTEELEDVLDVTPIKQSIELTDEGVKSGEEELSEQISVGDDNTGNTEETST